MTRRSVYSGTRWEPLVGYCRAKRVGSLIFVSGTTAVDEQGALVFAPAHREFFAEVAPAASCVEVSRLVAPGLLVEIEVDAVTDSNPSS